MAQLRGTLRPLALPALLALALWPSAATAQDWKGMGRMEGKVLDPDGKPIVGATVKLDLPSRGGGTVLKTDKKGRWAIAGIAAGQWNIDVEAEGFAARKSTINLPYETSRLAPIEIKLEKSGPAPPPPELLAAVHKGDEAYKAGRYPEARAEYEKVLALRPDLAPTLHELIARCYSQEGQYDKAVAHLLKVLEAQPDNVNLRVVAAQEALRGNMLDKGMQLLKGIDDSAITNPEIFYNIGVIVRNQPDAATDEAKSAMAIDYFSKAIALDAAYVDGYLQRALTYLGRQKVAEARADFQKVVELSPQSPQAEVARKALASLK